MLKALIFDVDGTLADTERDGHRVAFNLAFQEAGLNWDWGIELYGDLLAINGGKERMRYYAEQYDTAFLKQHKLDDTLKALHANKTRHYVELLSQGRIPLRPGVERLLNEARATGLTLAIATTTTAQNVSALIENTLGANAINWFRTIGAGDIVPAKKPAPDIYLHVLKSSGLRASECLAFEDSENGMRSSLAANLTTLITTNVYTKHHDFTGAALVLDQFGEPGQAASIISGTLDKSYLDITGIKKLHHNL